MSVVCVTGAGGFIGSTLTRVLATRGMAVRALSRRLPESLRQLENVRWHRVDIHDAASLESSLAGSDAVIHLAAEVSAAAAGRDALWDINVNVAGQVARAAMAVGVTRFVHVSSGNVYGPPDLGPDREETRIADPTSLYGQSKLAGEEAVQRAWNGSRRLVILRPGMVVGGRAPGMQTLARNLRRRRWAVTTPGDELLNPVWVEDLVDVLMAAVSCAAAGTINVAGDEAVLLEEYRDMVAAALGIRRRRWRLPVALAAPVALVAGARDAGDPAVRKVLALKARGHVLNGVLVTRRLRSWYGKPFSSLQAAIRKSVAGMGGMDVVPEVVTGSTEC